MAQYSHLSEPDPELTSIASISGPLTEDAVPLVRRALDDALDKRLYFYQTLLPSESTYKLEDHIFPVEDGEIRVRTISPTPTPNEDSEFPILVYLHGGGWAAGSIDMKDFELRILSVELRLAIVNVDYRLAPENRFPTGLNDCYAALKWTVESCARICGSLDKGFVVGGSSAGANLAAAVAHRSLKDPFFEQRKLTGHILQIPALVHPAAYPPDYTSELLSYEQNKDAPTLGKDLMDFYYECLKGPPADPDVSPLLADHTGLPPAYLQVCGLDPMRDEGLLYERLLRELGIPTKLDMRVNPFSVTKHWLNQFRYPGVPHGFKIMFPGIKAAKKWEVDLRGGLRWLFKSPV
ncbi:Alpha/Beta hydrolase protein [Mycena galopus ATCC 62051]|nr:Alpha/Beta hydrolase protein [Mycena galopus ATCC 62051]